MPDPKRTGERITAGLGGAEFAGMGLQFAFGILVFTALGAWLDRRLGTAPWLLVIGVFAGAAGGFYSMVRKITAAQRRDAEARAERKARQDTTFGGSA
jgi:F0F1-type ATP synthase assembly protein I